MSTLKTHNLQSPDASSVNIALAPNAGMVVTGISTFNDDVKLPDAKKVSFGNSSDLQIYHERKLRVSYDRCLVQEIYSIQARFKL